MTWFDAFERADIVHAMWVTAPNSFSLLQRWRQQSSASLAGILFNHRFLHVLLLDLLCTSRPPGYLTSKHPTFNLEGKLNGQW